MIAERSRASEQVRAKPACRVVKCGLVERIERNARVEVEAHFLTTQCAFNKPGAVSLSVDSCLAGGMGILLGFAAMPNNVAA